MLTFPGRGGRSQVISHKFRLNSAPRHPRHFCHKTVPGTNCNIFHCSKFQSSGCLISWLPKFRSCGLTKWLSPFFSQISSFLILNLYSSQTGYKAATSLTMVWCGWHVSGVLDTFLVSLVCPWSPKHVSCVPGIALVSSTKLSCWARGKVLTWF